MNVINGVFFQRNPKAYYRNGVFASNQNMIKGSQSYQYQHALNYNYKLLIKTNIKLMQ